MASKARFQEDFCASHLYEEVGGFDYNKVVTEPGNSDGQADAASIVFGLSNAPTAVDDEATIDPPSLHSAGSAQPSIATAEQWHGEVDPSFGPTAA